MSRSGAKQGLAPPGLVWEDAGTPASARFGDVYYSRGEGLAEKRHVFLTGCGLPGAWQGRRDFTVCELGFGTGLTFLATWRLWAETAPPGARLHYLAVEGHPLSPEELRRCLAPWAEVAAEAAALLRVYPHPQAGFHRLHPAAGIDLTLLCGDAALVLSRTEAAVDAWYLDGFAPAKNPAMWSTPVLREVARLSRGTDTRVATYTAAGQVRRELQAANFIVSTAPGFGRKRDMTQARYAGGAIRSRTPWFSPATAQRPGSAAIVGGGLAAAAAAAALRRNGWSCRIIEQSASLAMGASGTPAGVVMPRLTAGSAVDGDVHAGAWRYAVRSWQDEAFHAPCGVLQLAIDPQERERLAAVAAHGALPHAAMQPVAADAAADMAGVALPYGALYFPDGGWIDTKAFCSTLAAGAEMNFGQRVTTLENDEGVWRLLGAQGTIACADIVVLANSGGVGGFPQSGWLPLVARKGQVTEVAASQASASLRCVLAYGGTMTPARGSRHHVGATFDEMSGGDPSLDAGGIPISAAADSRNLAALAEVLPDLAGGLAPSGGAWAGVRWTTPDHLPIVGPLPDAAAFARDYAALRHGQHWVDFPPPAHHPGLYVMAGFGSHGLALAPLAAEILASHVAGTPWPLERDLIAALLPARFSIRSIKRPK